METIENITLEMRLLYVPFLYWCVKQGCCFFFPPEASRNFWRRKKKNSHFQTCSPPMTSHSASKGFFWNPVPYPAVTLMVIPQTIQNLLGVGRFVEAVLCLFLILLYLSGLSFLKHVCPHPRQTQIWLYCGHTTCTAFTTFHHLLCGCFPLTRWSSWKVADPSACPPLPSPETMAE